MQACRRLSINQVAWSACVRRTMLVACAGLTGAAMGQETELWRSRLYPDDWRPGLVDELGRGVADFSYAGYRHGEAPLPRQEGPRFSVVEAGADPAGERDSRAAFQATVDRAGAAGGGVVVVPAGLYRIEGRIVVTHSGVVIRGEGPDLSRVFFTTVPERGWRNHLQVQGALRQQGNLLLAQDAAAGSRHVVVPDPGGVAVGDDIAVGWVITEAFVDEHGMTGTWKSFNGTWRPFFLRRVRSLRPHGEGWQLELDVPLRYRARVRDGASVRRLSGYVRECGVEAIGLANAVAWREAWSRAGVHVLGFDGARDCWARDVSSFVPPVPEAHDFELQNGGIHVSRSTCVTIAHCRMAKAQNRGGGGAGYLFEVTRSNEILTRDCLAVAGRHNFIQNWDFGTSGCVWLRCESRDSRSFSGILDPIGWPAYCEYHHSLAMACLVDQCRLDDGWFGGNRGDWSSGAGHTGTNSVYWNTSGKGRLRSWQFGWGYVVGTENISVDTDPEHRHGNGTAPEDWTEGIGKGRTLRPQSLYEDQLRRRLAQSHSRD